MPAVSNSRKNRLTARYRGVQGSSGDPRAPGVDGNQVINRTERRSNIESAWRGDKGFSK